MYEGSLASKGDLVDNKFATLYSFEKLSIKNFFDDLYKKMIERYYLLRFEIK